jgi:hypothetical protein
MDDELRKLIEELQQKADEIENPNIRRDFKKKLQDGKSKLPTSKTSNNSSGSTGSALGNFALGLVESATLQTTAPDNFSAFDSFLNNVKTPKIDTGFGAIVNGVVNSAFEGTSQYIQEQSFLLTQVNKEIGLAGTLSQNFREAITEGTPEFARMGIPFKDVSESVEKLVEDTGRFALVGTDMLTRAGEIATAYGMKMEEVIGAYSNFENVGIGAADAQEAIADAGKRSLELGLQSRTTIDGMIANVGKLNEFGFKNGVEGLEKMVRRATEVRMSLDKVFGVAEKVFDPEGALDLSANLQVLGASFGDFNDPIRLMYMATNEVEGLQGALEGVAQSLATYNVETGGFEVTGANLRQARDVAKALGMDLEDVTKTAIALQERQQAAFSLEGLDITEENKQFITNLARMKDGEMSIDLQAAGLEDEFGKSSIKLSELTGDLAEKLVGFQDEFKEKSEKELVKEQVTLVENIKRNVNYLATMARLRAAGVGDEAMKSLVGMSFKETGVEMSDLLDTKVTELAEKFGEKDSVAIKNIQDKLGMTEYMKKEEEKKREQQKQQETPKTTKVVVEHNVKSDQLVGRFNKEWSLNPEQWTGGQGYLSPN